ncbi:phage antirepressor N-terminal domain-containing protein [Enterobacter sp.]|uniref:phage antirepressor N-terminal domain-containing protein n=1 Tax=Enterobacter sp. TaxID=42895 RepID=UPI00296EDEF7|nr:phage antirepressor N-terminal domain-containing protein [Enterobacter sp.]
MSNLAIKQSACTINVQFYGSELYVINHNGEPYTPMKPIVDGMGMDWASQFTKLKSRFAKGVVEITIPTAGGIQKMICLALRKLAAWLNTISPNKVRPEIRERVIRYQEECDDVLYEYWTKGQVTNPRKSQEKKTKTTSDDRTPLRDAVNMLVSKKHLLYPEAYAMIHQYFEVESIEDLTMEQLPLAVEYVHKLALEGELLPRESVFVPAPVEANSQYGNRVLLYLDANGTVIGSLPLREDQIMLSFNDFVELARRKGLIVMPRDELASKITSLLA